MNILDLLLVRDEQCTSLESEEHARRTPTSHAYHITPCRQTTDNSSWVTSRKTRAFDECAVDHAVWQSGVLVFCRSDWRTAGEEMLNRRRKAWAIEPLDKLNEL